MPLLLITNILTETMVSWEAFPMSNVVDIVADIQSLIYVSRFAQKIARTEPFASLIAGSIAPPPVILETNDQLSEFVIPSPANIGNSFIFPITDTSKQTLPRSITQLGAVLWYLVN